MEGTLVILPVTAAIAICVFGAGVYESAAQWRASVAATTAPAGEVWSSPLSLDETVELTHELDPDGSYLMAATTISTLGPTYVVVDAPRLAAVAAWQDQWTPGSGLPRGRRRRSAWTPRCPSSPGAGSASPWTTRPTSTVS